MPLLRETIPRLLFAIAIVASVAFFGWFVGPASPWFGLLASICVLGVLDLAMPFFTLRLPRSLQQIRPWELRDDAYRAIGVLAFGAMLRRPPLRWLNRRVYLAKSPRDLTAVRAHVEYAEAAHFWDGLITLPYLALASAQGWWTAVLGVLLFDLAGNVWPILHLRHVRARLERVPVWKSKASPYAAI